MTAQCSFPPASECDRDTLLDIAALAARGQSWALLGSSAHVEAICRLLVEEVEPELRAAEAELRRHALDPRSDVVATNRRATARHGEAS